MPFPRKNPREKANFLSKLTLFWTIKVFKLGYNKDFKDEHLFEPTASHRAKYLENLLEESWHRRESLTRAIVDVFVWKILFCGLIILLSESWIIIAQPLILEKLMELFKPEQDGFISNDTIAYAFLLIASCFWSAIFGPASALFMEELGMKIRIASSSLLYNKALLLKESQSNKDAIILGFMKKLYLIDKTMPYIHYLWIVPLMIMIVCWLLVIRIGISAILALCIWLIWIPVDFGCRKQAAYEKPFCKILSKSRIFLLENIIPNIFVIKTNNMENITFDLMKSARKEEVNKRSKQQSLNKFIRSFGIVSAKITITITLILVLAFKNQITVAQTFVFIAYYNSLQPFIVKIMPKAIYRFQETFLIIKEIDQFLLADNYVQEKHFDNHPPRRLRQSMKEKESPMVAFPQRNLKIMKGELAVITGSHTDIVSIRQEIVDQLSQEKDDIEIHGSIAFVPRQPWICNGTIKQNILFGHVYNKSKFNRVVNVCGLLLDKSFENEFDTVVGKYGVSLDEEHRVRIVLARNLYRLCDIYIFDDFMSKIDPIDAEELYGMCIERFLKGRTRLIISQQASYLKNVDHTVILNEKNEKMYEVQKVREDSKDGTMEKNDDYSDKETKALLPKKTNRRGMKLETKIIKQNKWIWWQNFIRVYFKYGRNLTNVLIPFMILFPVFLSSFDYTFVHWLYMNEVNMTLANADTEKYSKDENITISNTSEFNSNGIEIDSEVDYLRQYMKSVSLGLIVATLLICCTRSLLLYLMRIKVANKMYKILFMKLLKAKMRYFEMYAPRAVSIFYTGIKNMDVNLTKSAIGFFENLFFMVGCLTILFLVATPHLIWPLVAVGSLFFYLRKFYTITNLNITTIEQVTRSYINCHMNKTFQGLSMIRAFGIRSNFKKEFYTLQDLHTTYWHLQLGARKAFKLCLNILSTSFIATVTLILFALNPENIEFKVGLLLTQAFVLSVHFHTGMWQYVKLEQGLSTLKDIKDIEDIEDEADYQEPEERWPEEYKIEFIKRSVLLKTSTFEDKSKFIINRGDKITIVGQRDANQMALLNGLFRLHDLKTLILLNGTNLVAINPVFLRSKISLVSTHSVLSCVTFRENLDPSGTLGDIVIWHALERVGLKPILENFECSLDNKVMEKVVLNEEQCVLLSLARAITQQKPILVIDNISMTDSVHRETDFFVQKAIDEKLSQCTVISITNRKSVAMNSKMVLVFDEENVPVEYGNPKFLKSNKNSSFYLLLHDGLLIED